MRRIRTSASKQVAVQMDPLESIDISGDSTFALLLEAQRRGYKIWVYPPQDLSLETGAGVKPKLMATVRSARVQDKAGDHVRLGGREKIDLAVMDVILMRQDPPFDMGYLTATYLLEHVQRLQGGGTLVVNDPTAVRDAPEKLLATHFSSLMPPTLVSGDLNEIRAFRTHYPDIIVKPLYGNGGAGIFHMKPGDENLSALVELHLERTQGQPLMIQRYEEAVRQGDKRIILVEGEPIGALNRVPSTGEVRSNLHVGGRAEPAQLTPRDREICAELGPYLRERGLLFTGIDVIGNWLTEINVTSPTGLRSLDKFEGINSAGLVWDAIERRKDAGAAQESLGGGA